MCRSCFPFLLWSDWNFMTAFKKAKPREKIDPEVVRIRCRSIRKRKTYNACNTGAPIEIYYENENNNIPSEQVNVITDVFFFVYKDLSVWNSWRAISIKINQKRNRCIAYYRAVNFACKNRTKILFIFCYFFLAKQYYGQTEFLSTWPPTFLMVYRKTVMLCGCFPWVFRKKKLITTFLEVSVD